MFPELRRNRRIKRWPRAPAELDGLGSFLTTSARITVEGTGCGPDGLLRSANTAMRKAKAAGEDRLATFDTAMGRRSRERVDLEGNLGGAAEEDFVVRYRPLMLIWTGETTVAETLVNCKHLR